MAEIREFVCAKNVTVGMFFKFPAPKRKWYYVTKVLDLDSQKASTPEYFEMYMKGKVDLFCGCKSARFSKETEIETIRFYNPPFETSGFDDCHLKNLK